MDAWTLCAEFIERMLTDAQVAAARVQPGGLAPEVDWDRIWGAGNGAPSEEAAIGRVVSEAWQVAQEMASGAAGSHTLPSSLTGPEPAAEPHLDPYLRAGTEQLDQPEQVTAPAEVPMQTEPAAVVSAPSIGEPVIGQSEPVVAAGANGTLMAEPVVVPEEPVTTPVAEATSAVGSVTLDRPDITAFTVSEPAEREELLTPPAIFVKPEQQETEAAAKRVVRHHSGWFRFFTWLEVIGAIMILFVVWQLWGTSIAQGQAQDQLKAQFDALEAHHHPPKVTAAGPSLIAASVRSPSPPDGSVVAQLQIPAIGVDQYVVEGTTTDDLSKGPGHYTGTAAPGQAGNVAIAGHRTTHGAPFNRLGDLRKGDRIILTTTSDESLTYIVSGTPTAVPPSDVSVLNYFGDNRITLTTCNPEFSSTQRLIAVGELIQPGSKAVKLPKHITYHVSNTGTNSWVWSLLPVVGIEVCLLVLLGMTYRRFDFWFGRIGRWIILLPLWAAGLYLLFDTLTKFLPASV